MAAIVFAKTRRGVVTCIKYPSLPGLQASGRVEDAQPACEVPRRLFHRHTLTTEEKQNGKFNR